MSYSPVRLGDFVAHNTDFTTLECRYKNKTNDNT